MNFKECIIKGFEGLYHIYENGDIYSVKDKQILRPKISGYYYKYAYVTLRNNKAVLRFPIHKLMAIHFLDK